VFEATQKSNGKGGMDMDFCWCTLQVKDMNASLKFYEGVVGLKLKRRFSPAEGMEIAFLGEGATQVELICNYKEENKPSCDGISLGFETRSLDDTMNFIHSKGIKIQGGPYEPNPHTRFIYVQDPDGYRVQFVERS
jgi:lactoylglutathione lyase